jgi:hypothetical protein
MSDQPHHVKEFLKRGRANAGARGRECAGRVRGCWNWFAVCPPFDQDPAYQAANAWLHDEFKPNSEIQGYDKALAYAWRRFDQGASASETLDKKADNIMRNAGLIAGLLGLAMNTLHMGQPKLLIPSLVAFIVSLMFAADAISDIGAGHSSDAWISASLHCAVVGRDAVNNWKAKRIRWATYALCAGLVLFLLPIVGMLF